MQKMVVERDILQELQLWKDSVGRKPVLLKGARQIGKSWVMEEFGRRNFDYCAVFDFDRQPEVKSVFRETKDPGRLVKELAIYTDVPIVPGKTLIVFDEIQECEEQSEVFL